MSSTSVPGAARRRAAARRAAAAVALAIVLGGCGADRSSSTDSRHPDLTVTSRSEPTRPPAVDVYRYDTPGALAPPARRARALVYVPNSVSNTVSVIDPRSMRVIATYPTGALPQHVTPSWDLRTLWVDNDEGNSLTPIDPSTGRPGRPVRVADPYNLYFTPDGAHAIVVAERLRRLDFRDPHTMALRFSLSVPRCAGVDHMDFSASGRYAYASCEFAGRMIEVDLRTRRVVSTLTLHGGSAMPQDVKLSPDGSLLYVADMRNGGVWEIAPRRFVVTGWLATGAGAHGLYPSRDARLMYVSNRDQGSISVVSFRRRAVVRTWQLPRPASPDMGGVSSDGRTLWLSGRYNGVVYAIDTTSGRLRATIPVGQGPHGLCVWPQPGRHSLGHTGILR